MSEEISMLVGLGNPGQEYVGTRHNAGRELLEAFANAQNIHWEKHKKSQSLITWYTHNNRKILCGLPETFMNLSGQSVQSLCSFYKTPPQQVVVLVDEVQIPAGQLKLTVGGSAGGHNGIADIIRVIGPDFWRLKVGVGLEPKSQDLVNYVLGRCTPEQAAQIRQKLSTFIDSVRLLIDKPPAIAQNHLNIPTL